MGAGGTGEEAGSGDGERTAGDATGEGTEEEEAWSCVKGLMMTLDAEGVGDEIAGAASTAAALRATTGEAAGGGGEAVGAMGEGIREEEAGEANMGLIAGGGAALCGTAGVGTRFGSGAASALRIEGN